MNETAKSSSDGNMSDYDLVSDIDSTPPSSPRAGSGAMASPRGSSPPPKGWSTLSLSDARIEKDGSRYSAKPSLLSSTCNKDATSHQTATTPKSGPFHCQACQRLLRDCVECPSCHSLFCREHLRVDSSTGMSPCPCKPCRDGPRSANDNKITPSATSTTSATPAAAVVAANTAFASSRQLEVYPREAFLPNIPVQRMADAVPSRCNACGSLFSWGDLATHECDLQTVSCDLARWGCTWTGKRHQLADHITASTCPGLLARAEHELVGARAEISAMRAELAAALEAKKDAEHRAEAAEKRSEELEGKLAVLENNRKIMSEQEEAAAGAAAEAEAAVDGKRRTEGASVRSRSGRGTSGGVAGGSGGGPPPSRGRHHSHGHGQRPAQQQQGRQQRQQQEHDSVLQEWQQQQQEQQEQQARAQALQRQQQQQQQPPPTSVAPTTTLNFTSILNKAGFSPNAFPLSSTTTPTPTAASDKAAAAATTTATSRRPSTAVAPPRPRAVARGPKMVVEAACQAPVPATEACLRPYLEQPVSLLEKKVVVFWPR